MATFDEELKQAERDIRTLKIEYEQFFGGGRPRPPSDTQWRVETLMRRFNERTAELSPGQRFHFNNLAQTYAKYVEMWRKKTMQKEGSLARHAFGAAAKAIEAERARKAALLQPVTTPSIGAEAVAAAVTQASGPKAIPHVNGAATQAFTGETPFVLSFSDPAKEQDNMEKLYQKVVEARTRAGEKTAAPSLKDFQRFVQQKSKELQDKGGRDIEYTVNVEAGRVKLKARIAR